MNEIEKCCEKHGSCTISNATYRSEDLIPAFTGALAELAPEEAAKIKADPDYAPIYAKLEEMDPDPWEAPPGLPSYEEDPEMAEMVVYLVNEDLFEKLNEHAPEGYYFNGHESNLSEFGFWKLEEEEG